jgi:hypothetical protein
LLREATDAVPATGDIVTLAGHNLVDIVVQGDLTTAPDGGDELPIEPQLTDAP